MLVAAAGLSVIPGAFGAITSCPSSPSLLGLTTYLGSGNGCSTVDATYTNFSVGTATGTINGVALPGASTVLIPSALQIFLATEPSNPRLLEFSSPGLLGPTSQNGCSNISGDLGWCIQGKNDVLVSSYTYTATFSNAISTFGIAGTALANGGVSTATVFREICLGQATFSQGCANYLVVQGGAVNTNFSSLSFSSSVNFAPTNVIAIRDTVYLATANPNSSWATFLPYDTIDSPEPATFGIMGAALAALGFARRRRKRS
ncbi:MAG: PEP-CTERM sorting domain-containing protein [Bryobacteraceae bacterium]